jgi:hypothetical protein
MHNHRSLLPVTIAPGMLVVDVADARPSSIVAFTEAYCLYRSGETSALTVAPWRELALADICPAAPLLPTDVRQRDEHNLRAVVLRELLALEEFGLTAAEAAARDELMQLFCGDTGGDTGDDISAGTSAE